MEKYRKRIDEIDKKIAELLDERLDTVKEIGEYKRKQNIPVLDSSREKEKVRSFESIFREEKRPYIKGVIEKIMEGSRNYQEDMKTMDHGLLGRMLGHSLSPEVHKYLGGYEFGLIEKEPRELDEFFERKEFKGLCVTMPYKRTVMKYCDRISETAKATNSINTIVKEDDGTLSGYNTDYDGFAFVIDGSGVEIKGAKCIILGSGGVSGTVRKVLQDKGAGGIVNISRNGEDNYGNISKHFDADVVVNATPVGMYPDADRTPLDISDFKNCRGYFDLIYNPLRTRTILEAEDAGIPSFGGLEMLVYQAAEGCRLFTGSEVSGKVGEVCRRIRHEMENIVLIGMPGCGKSVVGKRLSELMNRDFIDTDVLIGERTGRTPEEIIREDGESAFRDVEEEVIRSISGLTGMIIATGGGVVERAGNLGALRRNGKIVYIVRAVDELTDEGRPLSSDYGIRELFSRREEKYRQWCHMSVENIDVEETAKYIENNH